MNRVMCPMFLRIKEDIRLLRAYCIDNRRILCYDNIVRTGGAYMETTNLNIRTDREVKIAAERIFEELGLNMTTAVNIFLRQTIRENGIPFELKLDVPNDITAAAIAEGRALARNKNVSGYSSMKDLRAALDV